MAMPPHSRFACPPSEAAERIAVVFDCWLFTPRQRRNRMKRGKSRLITLKNNIGLQHVDRRARRFILSSSPGTSAGGYEAAYNAALEDAGLRERSNFKTGERSRSHALRRSEGKPGGGAKVRYARSACVVFYCGVLPTGSFSRDLEPHIFASLGVT